MLVWLPVPPQALCKHSRICFKTAQRSRTTKSATDVYIAAPAAALNRKFPWPEQLNSSLNVAVNIFCLGNMRKATLISSETLFQVLKEVQGTGKRVRGQLDCVACTASCQFFFPMSLMVHKRPRILSSIASLA